MKYLVLFCALLCICSVTGCEVIQMINPTPSPEPTPEVTQTPILLKIKETETPAPMTPSPTPEPTEVPNPYTEGVEPTVVREGFQYMPLNDAMKKRITGLSYPANPEECEISYDKLSYLQLCYYDFEGNEHKDGEMIVHHLLAEEVLNIFGELYDIKYPLTSVKLVDDFGEVADDNKSMEANNTSSFCYRKVTGSSKLSRHSYGAAIDINPMLNPYIKKDGTVSPENGKEYADRKKDFPGKITTDDECYKIFKKYKWEWGGNFSSEKDYQHFSKEIDYKK